MLAEHRITRRVTFAETDVAGVMHFSNYYRWMEEVEHAFLRSRGISVIQEHDGVVYSWPRITTSCEYLAPAHFEDEVELHFQLLDLSEKAMTHEVSFMLAGRRIARGRTKAVCCTMTGGTFKSVPIPDWLRDILKGEARK
jgi:YbgC/YbaW family acyl-CoA thioester hydrolase